MIDIHKEETDLEDFYLVKFETIAEVLDGVLYIAFDGEWSRRTPNDFLSPLIEMFA